jgi:hypothetical protein
MSLPDSSYETTRILPKLDKQSTEQQYKWSKAFWIFWNGAKLLAVAVQILLAHNDEKWFYTIVVRTHNKCVPVLGVFPVKQSVHHKSHIEKIIALATTGFPPHDNNIEKGGVAHKPDFVDARGTNAKGQEGQLQACLSRGWNVPLSKDSRE